MRSRSWRVTASYLAVAALLLLFGIDSALRSSTAPSRAAGVASATTGLLLAFLSFRVALVVDDDGLTATNLLRSRSWTWADVHSIETGYRQLTPLTRAISFGHLVVTDSRGHFPVLATP